MLSQNLENLSKFLVESNKMINGKNNSRDGSEYWFLWDQPLALRDRANALRPGPGECRKYVGLIHNATLRFHLIIPWFDMI